MPVWDNRFYLVKFRDVEIMNIREDDTHPNHLGGCNMHYDHCSDYPDVVSHLMLGVGDHQEPLHGQGHRHEDGAGQRHLGQGQDDRENVRGNLENIMLTRLIKT